MNSINSAKEMTTSERYRDIFHPVTARTGKIDEYQYEKRNNAWEECNRVFDTTERLKATL
jgi:DNA-binding cell septation regulator SpoVG